MTRAWWTAAVRHAVLEQRVTPAEIVTMSAMGAPVGHVPIIAIFDAWFDSRRKARKAMRVLALNVSSVRHESMRVLDIHHPPASAPARSAVIRLIADGDTPTFRLRRTTER